MIRRYPFENVFNLRDLGGYPISIHSITRWRTFLRADDLSEMSEKDQDYLVALGLSAVIDLRSDQECRESVDPFSKNGKVHYIHAPTSMMAHVVPMSVENLSLSDLYTFLIEDEPFIYKVFTEFSKAQGMVLFHCAAGKDRTGVIAMLLLLLMNVPEQDIVSDYQQSSTHLQEKYDEQSLVQQPEYQNYINLMHSKAETMRMTLDYFNQHYTSVEEYFLSKGISLEVQAEIVRKFNQEI